MNSIAAMSQTNFESFSEAFEAFATLGDESSSGKFISLSQSNEWMNQAKIIDGTIITTTDTAIAFKKKKTIKMDIEQYIKFLQDLAAKKFIDLEEVMTKMTQCAKPIKVPQEENPEG